MTVTKCFNSAQPHAEISIETAKRELTAMSKKDNLEIKNLTGQDYGADYYSEFMVGGFLSTGDCSYHLNN